MAKVKRSVLKEIVKECLLEILFEGIDSEPGYEDEEPIREARSIRASRPSSRNLAEAVEEQRKTRPSRTKSTPVQRPTQVNEAVGELTQDPMMAAIYADTAQTTLQEQTENRRVPTDKAAAMVDHAEDMGDIFEGAGNWAAIAFGETE